jgi:hypothetical protein
MASIIVVSEIEIEPDGSVTIQSRTTKDGVIHQSENFNGARKNTVCIAMETLKDVLRSIGESCAHQETAEGLAKEIASELVRATNLHKTFASAHEGYAVLQEEVDELWDLVKTNPKKINGGTQEWNRRMRSEAVQVAAMGMRFVRDVCDR